MLPKNEKMSYCGAPFCGASVRPNMLSMPKAASEYRQVLCCNVYLPTTALAGKVMQSVVSVRPSVSSQFFELTDL